MLQGKGSWLPREGTTWVSGNTSVRDSRTKPAVARLCSLKMEDLTINKKQCLNSPGLEPHVMGGVVSSDHDIVKIMLRPDVLQHLENTLKYYFL